MDKKIAVILTAVLASFFWIVLVLGLNVELRESNKELLATREVLEKTKLDLGTAEEELEKALEKAEEENLALKLVSVAFLKMWDGKIPIKKEALEKLLRCCDGKLSQQNFRISKNP